MRADIDAAGPLAVVDLPDVDVAGRRIVPEDVVGAVAVEIAAERGLPAGRMRAGIDAAGPLAVVVDLPDVDAVGRGVVPEDVVRPVAVEVAAERGLPARRMRPDIDASGPVAVGNLPQLDVARGWIEPDDVVG